MTAGTMRNLKSIYYDRYTGLLTKATLHEQYPAARPRRYLFIGQMLYVPTIYNKRVTQKLTEAGIKIEKRKDYPF